MNANLVKSVFYCQVQGW